MADLIDALEDIRVINCYGPVSRLCGAPVRALPEEITEAATRWSYNLADLQNLASQKISEVTNAEAGIVVNGAAAGLCLATAACIAGDSARIMELLPDTRGISNEIIIAKTHRNSYDHSFRSAGAKLVEVGFSDQVSGAGVRHCEAWEYEAAINENTVAIAYVVNRDTAPPLSEICALGKQHGIPVIVDAAAQLPPVDNLHRFIEDGASLVSFSGGKAIGGPQSTGILCGEASLIGSALLQSLDLDMDQIDRAELLQNSIFRNNRFVGFSHNGIGRICKISKEGIVSFLWNFERFNAEAAGDRAGQQANRAQILASKIAERLSVGSALSTELGDWGQNLVRIVFEDGRMTPQQLRSFLLEQKPKIYTRTDHGDDTRLLLNCFCLNDGDVDYVVKKICVFESKMRDAARLDS